MNIGALAALLFFIGLSAAAAMFGALFQPGEWYQALSKPDWTPPNWLFGPVWTILYVMIAVAGWLVWREAGFGIAMVFWMLQMILNAAWSWIMFDQHQVGLALTDIFALWVVIILFAFLAWPASPVASVLFVPYLVWVSYAGALNFAIWRLNS